MPKLEARTSLTWSEWGQILTRFVEGFWSGGAFYNICNRWIDESAAVNQYFVLFSESTLPVLSSVMRLCLGHVMLLWSEFFPTRTYSARRPQVGLCPKFLVISVILSSSLLHVGMDVVSTHPIRWKWKRFRTRWLRYSTRSTSPTTRTCRSRLTPAREPRTSAPVLAANWNSSRLKGSASLSRLPTKV